MPCCPALHRIIRFLERNRREVAEKTEQLKALSFVATLLAGFATEAILQFSYNPEGHDALVALLAFTTACIVSALATRAGGGGGAGTAHCKAHPRCKRAGQGAGGAHACAH